MTTTTSSAAVAQARALLSRRRLATVTGYGVVVVGGAVWVGRAGLPQVPTVTSWWWAVVAVIACGASFWAAAAAVLAVTPVRLSHRAVLATQVAACATKLVTPASIGLIGLNARLLQSQGASLPAAIAAIAGGQLAQVALTVAVLPVVLLASGLSLPLPSAPGHAWVAVHALALAATAAALVVAVTARGVWFVAAVRLFNALLEPLSLLLRSSRRAMMITLGAAGVTASFTLCLYACVRALGADADLAGLAVVVLVGSSLGSAVPTPGGVGGVEGAMVTVSLAVGVPVETALPAVLVFRLVTFWLPVPVGVAAMVWLRHARHL